MANAIDVHVGTCLRLKRCILSLSQRQLSERLDCDEAHIAAMVLDTWPPGWMPWLPGGEAAGFLLQRQVIGDKLIRIRRIDGHHAEGRNTRIGATVW